MLPVLPDLKAKGSNIHVNVSESKQTQELCGVRHLQTADLQTGRLYIVLPIRIYAIYTYTSIYTYTYTYIPIPIRSASLANRSSSLANPSASLQVCSLQVSHTENYGVQ